MTNDPTWRYLVEVQAHDDVGPLCLLVDHFQEVDMTDVCEEFTVKATTINKFTANRDQTDWNQLGAFFVYGYGRDQTPQPHRWWCPQAAALPPKQTGWSSGKSGGTETLPSTDCASQDPWARETTRSSGRIPQRTQGNYSNDGRILE